MAEISSIGSAGTAAPSLTPTTRLVPSLSQVAAEQLQQSEQAFDTAIAERNRVAAAAAAAACVYSRQGNVGSATQPGGQLRTSA